MALIHGHSFFSAKSGGTLVRKYDRSSIRPWPDSLVSWLRYLRSSRSRSRCFCEVRLDRLPELRLVVLDGDHEVAAALDDVACDLLLAAHGVDRDQRVGQLDLLQEQGDRRDLVGLLLGGDLAQGDPFLAGPGADDVQRAEAVRRVVGPPAGLAVDGDQPVRAAPRRARMAWAIQSWKHFWKASGFSAISRRRMQSREGMPLGSARNCSEPVAAIGGPAVDGRRAVAAAHHAADGDHHDVDQQVLAVARMPRVGEGLEVGADGFDVHPSDTLSGKFMPFG